MEQEVIYLVGDFRPDILERWTDWAKLTGRTIQHSSFEEIDRICGTNPLIILDEHGLNELSLPGDTP